MQRKQKHSVADVGCLMRKLILVAGLLLAWTFSTPPPACADYFNYPCNYPFVGTSASVDVLIYAGGQYCDGPMEINGSHYHCVSAGGGLSGGGIGLAPISGINLGAFGGSGIGGAGGDCHFVCPDLTRAPAPNPPIAWVKEIHLDPKKNDCRDHMTPAGDSSTPQGGDTNPADLPPNPAPPSPPPPAAGDGGGSLVTPGPMPLP
jgi:hypothetical protein